MIACPSITKHSIRQHYDLATPFYRLLWGPHIHHGLWEKGDATPDQAQQHLIDRLAGSAGIGPGQRVLDVGCGMGGSSIALARRFRCRVTGLTLSPLQRFWATVSAGFQGVGDRACFRCADAETVRLRERSFDVVWNVECSEHLFDKPAFFRRVASWLKPGGRLALCAWLAGEEGASAPGAPVVAGSPDHATVVPVVAGSPDHATVVPVVAGSPDHATAPVVAGSPDHATAPVVARSPDHATVVRLVCEGFLCPSLGTADDYLGWFRDAGLVRGNFDDLTAQVEQTWDICLHRIQVSGIYRLGGLFGQDMRRFLDHFVTLREAYRTRAMRYGLFIAEKPEC